MVKMRHTAVNEKEKWYENKQPIAATALNFIELVFRSNIFVDKSLLIKEVMEDYDKIYIFKTAYLGGKTINLSMMKAFFEIPINYTDKKRTSISDISTTSSYKLFVDGVVTPVYHNSNLTEKLKNPLLIASHKDIINRYLGKHPVIYVDLGHIEKSVSFDNVMRGIRKRLSGAYKKHAYMVNIFRGLLKKKSISHNHTLLVNVQKRFEAFVNILNNDGIKTSDEDWQGSLRFLSELLYDHFKKPVIMMIDDYDLSANRYFQHGGIDRFDLPVPDIGKLKRFYAKFFEETFERNYDYMKAFLTGETLVTLEFYLNEYYGTKECTEYRNDNFIRYFGFHETEITELFEAVQMPQDVPDMTQLGRAHGYRILRNVNLTMYPASAVVEELGMMQQSINYIKTRRTSRPFS